MAEETTDQQAEHRPSGSRQERVVMPLQPIRIDERGVERFVPNRIVEALLETSSLDLNKIACMDFTQQEQEQFAQLIGYSVGGWSELSYVSDEALATVEKMMEGKSEQEAANEYLRETLIAVRSGMKEIVPHLFQIHPDDLEA